MGGIWGVKSKVFDIVHSTPWSLIHKLNSDHKSHNLIKHQCRPFPNEIHILTADLMR
jgi:hypothetical protein